MKHKYFLLILFSLISFFCRSQSVSPDVVASSGDFFANSSGQIQWTLGEIMVETYLSPNNILTQGFHQPFNAVATGISITPNNGSISVYPNPTNESVFINFNTLKGNYLVSLMDATGQVLQSKEVSATNFNSYQLPVKNYSDGVYLINISGSENNYNQSIRIIKTN